MTPREKQKQADLIATDNGFDYAQYLGDENKLSVYLVCHKDRDRKTGLPLFVTIADDGAINQVFGFKYMHMVKE